MAEYIAGSGLGNAGRSSWWQSQIPSRSTRHLRSTDNPDGRVGSGPCHANALQTETLTDHRPWQQQRQEEKPSGESTGKPSYLQFPSSHAPQASVITGLGLSMPILSLYSLFSATCPGNSPIPLWTSWNYLPPKPSMPTDFQSFLCKSALQHLS